jgi:hypothetical protein
MGPGIIHVPVNNNGKTHISWGIGLYIEKDLSKQWAKFVLE